MGLFKYLALFTILLTSTISSSTSSTSNEDEELLEDNNEELPEWAFSPSALHDLALFETEIYNLSLEFQDFLKNELLFVDRWIEDYEVSLTMDSATNSIAEHPLMSYRMIRRFAKDLKIILNKISKNGPEKRFIEILDDVILPNVSDLENIADNIVRLQNIYDFKARDLIRGRIFKSKTPPVRLSLTHAFEIGKRALDTEMYPEALDWLHTVLRLTKPNKVIKETDEFLQNKMEKIKKSIRQLIQQHDAIHDEIESDQDNFYDLNLNRFNTKINSLFSNRSQLETLKTAQIKEYLGTPDLLAHFAFMLLCDGYDFQTEVQKFKLVCYQDTQSDPYWRINPLKIEVHSWDPYLIQIYDVIGDSRIEFFKQSASPYLTRSTVGGDMDAIQVTSGRTSSQTYLYEDHHPILHDFNSIVGKITGLQLDNRVEYYSGEPLQIAAYSFGGYYGFHVDSMQEQANDATGGDRLATFMIYLNDVTLGGHTAFPTIGTVVAPVKGSAVLWYNLKKNGDVDERTFHGGCPVILGQKWIANKWIRYNANFQKRQCTLNPHE